MFWDPLDDEFDIGIVEKQLPVQIRRVLLALFFTHVNDASSTAFSSSNDFVKAHCLVMMVLTASRTLCCYSCNAPIF